MLAGAGIEFSLAAANIDEKAIRHDDYDQLPLLVARAKADALAATLHEPALLITADTVVIYRGELREKPTSSAQARAYLASYESNTPAWVNTGLVVTNLDTGKRVDGVGKGAVYLRQLPPEVIEQVIADGSIFGCAGAFSIDIPQLAPFVQKLEGEASAIMGLPLQLTRGLLKAVGS